MRKSVRAILATGIVAVALVAASAPAAAKCGHGGIPCPDPVRVRITVDGPGLAAPLVIRGKDAWTMLNVTGVTSRPYNVLNPVPAELGPPFQAVYRFKQGDREVLVYQDLYPYAAGRPFTFTPPGQRFVHQYEDMGSSGNLFFPVAEAGHGWRGSRTLGSILQEHGFPEEMPAAATRATHPVAASVGGGNPPWWIGGAVLLLIAVAAVAIRRRPA